MVGTLNLLKTARRFRPERASKLAADAAARVYGLYFGVNLSTFRGGGFSGHSHLGVELHGFLFDAVKLALSASTYELFGSKGKPVRDNNHSFDIIQAFESFPRNPRPGEVHNLGGGRKNAVCVLKAINLIGGISGRTVIWS